MEWGLTTAVKCIYFLPACTKGQICTPLDTKLVTNCNVQRFLAPLVRKETFATI